MKRIMLQQRFFKNFSLYLFYNLSLVMDIGSCWSQNVVTLYNANLLYSFCVEFIHIYSFQLVENVE